MSGITGPHFRTLFVVNPKSRHGKTRTSWPDMLSRIEGVWRERPDWCFTSGPGDATQRTRAALAAGYEMVVAVGGDGTNNEVVNGFFHDDPVAADGTPLAPRPVREGAVFGWITSGTGGDFRRTFGVSNDIDAAARRLAGRSARPIDAGRLVYTADDGVGRGVRYFVNIASCGMSGEVDAALNASRKRFGAVSFAAATIRTMATFVPRWVRVRVDDTTAVDAEVLTVVVANGRWFGAGVFIAPDARIDDGLFDVIVLRGSRALDAFTFAREVYTGKHIGHPRVTASRGRRVEVTPLDRSPNAPPVRLDVDGEVPGRLPATFEILPGALQLKI